LVDSMNSMGHFQKVFSLFVCLLIIIFICINMLPHLYMSSVSSILDMWKHDDQDFMGFCRFL
jgi:hypothetical protein